MSNLEFIPNDIEIISDEDCISVLHALHELNWEDELQEPFSDAGVYVQTQVKDPRTEEAYILTTPEGYLNTYIHMPGNLPRFEEKGAHGMSDTWRFTAPFVCLQPVESEVQQVDALYAGRFRKYGPMIEYYGGGDWGSATDMDKDSKQAFAGTLKTVLEI